MLILPALSACGSHQASHAGEYGTTPASVPDSGAVWDSAAMTLTPGDLGNGWRRDRARTHAMTAAESIGHDPAALRGFEYRAFWRGYEARSTARGGASVVSTIAVYWNPVDAIEIANSRVVRTALTTLGRTLGQRTASPVTRLTTPADAPGDLFALWRRDERHRVSYMATWVDSNVLASVVLGGPRASTARLMAFVRRQERKISAELQQPFGAPPP